MAYPVGPPKERPIAKIKIPTTIGFKPSVKVFAPNANKPDTKTNVPITSVIVFAAKLRTAGPVANVPKIAP